MMSLDYIKIIKDEHALQDFGIFGIVPLPGWEKFAHDRESGNQSGIEDLILDQNFFIKALLNP